MPPRTRRQGREKRPAPYACPLDGIGTWVRISNDMDIHLNPTDEQLQVTQNTVEHLDGSHMCITLNNPKMDIPASHADRITHARLENVQCIGSLAKFSRLMMLSVPDWACCYEVVLHVTYLIVRDGSPVPLPSDRENLTLSSETVFVENATEGFPCADRTVDAYSEIVKSNQTTFRNCEPNVKWILNMGRAGNDEYAVLFADSQPDLLLYSGHCRQLAISGQCFETIDEHNRHGWYETVEAIVLYGLSARRSIDMNKLAAFPNLEEVSVLIDGPVTFENYADVLKITDNETLRVLTLLSKFPIIRVGDDEYPVHNYTPKVPVDGYYSRKNERMTAIVLLTKGINTYRQMVQLC